MNFTDFNLAPELLDGLESMGFVSATPIQEQAIPVIQEKHDIIACAQTGTGKTASYLLPILNHLTNFPSSNISAVILVPTRELALQIDQQIMGLAYFTGASSIAVYGGGDGMVYEQQKRAILEGVNIIVATPGRLIAHLASGKSKLEKLDFLVLDEADRMLDMGFHDDIMKIISYFPKKRQNLLFSATMPPKIRTLAKKLLENPKEINIAISKPSESIDQQAYLVYDPQKIQLLTDILKNPEYQSVIIFASKKDSVKSIQSQLEKLKFRSMAFHSDIEQTKREEILNRFKNKTLPILVGTDVISRGIDVEGISLVINYDIPSDPEDYVHRIGRTARADKTGTAISFINDGKDQQKFGRIESLLGYEVQKKPLPEGYDSGPEYTPQAAPKKTFFKKKPRNNKYRSEKRKTS